MLAPEERMRECSMDKAMGLARAMTNNAWDGRLTRERQFAEKLKAKYPGVEVKTLSTSTS